MARALTGGDYFSGAIAPISAYPFTISARVYIIGTSSTTAVFGLGVSTGHGGAYVRLNATNDAAAAVAYNSAGTNADSRTSGTNTAWYTFTGIFRNDTYRQIYRDNTAGAASTTNIALTFGDLDTVYVGIGYWGGVLVSPMNLGRMAECAIWNDELSVGDIAALTSGYTMQSVKPAALRFFCPFDGRLGAAGNERDWISGQELTQVGSPALIDNPRIIYPRRRSMIAVPSAAASTYTLSNATYVPGSLLSTGVTPRFTVTEG